MSLLQGKKCMFLVQGEGRGHMTQSISMKQALEKAGMEVCEVVIGKNSHRDVPQFYYDRMQVPITRLDSPGIAMDKRMKSALPFGTFLSTLIHMPQFFKSLRIIHEKVKQHKPDVIVNFFEPLCGLYYMFYGSKVPMISVAHHNLYNHPKFKMPAGQVFTRYSLKFYVWMTTFGAKKNLALSFYPFRDYPKNSTYVIPPLLREELSDYTPAKGDYLLVYLLNSGYMEDIIKWHKQNPEVSLNCFVDKKDMDEVYRIDDTLAFHRLNDRKFLDMMAHSKGLVTTAGFESICEAMYFGKPVLMVPVEGHYEQYCNSQDAEKAGAGLYNDKFDINKFLKYLPTYRTDNGPFINWVGQAPDMIVKHVYSTLQRGNNVRQLFPKVQPDRETAASI